MENAVAAKLRALTRLQIIDSSLDKIHRLRGSLPEEVKDLEDDLEGLETRKARVENEIEKLQQEIAGKRQKIDDFQGQIKRYTEQQNNVKNSREYEALNKEIEYANLEILTSEKKIRQFNDQIGGKKEQLQETNKQVDDKKRDLNEKKKELQDVVAETQIEENKLLGGSEEAASHIEKRLLKGYLKIRENMRNGLAVVTTDRDACGGCFSIIPPQTLIELKKRIRLIHCENCGRLLVNDTFFDEVKQDIKDLVAQG